MQQKSEVSNKNGESMKSKYNIGTIELNAIKKLKRASSK